MRVTSSGDVGVGTAAPIAKLESNTTTDIALLGTSVSRGIVGRLGPATSCPGTYAVGGCGAATGNGVVGTATGGIGVLGDSTARGVVGTLGGTSCAGTYAVGGCGATTGNGVFGSSANGIGVLGDSTTRGVAGTLGVTSCAGAYAVGGCAGSTVAAGVFGQSAATVALLAVTNTGNLFVGQAPEGANKARIDSTGKGFFNGGTQNSGADYAESIPIAGQAKLQPGDVLTVAAQHGFAVQRSRSAASPLVAGVYSTKPAVLAVGRHGVDDSLAGEAPVAMVGIVPTKVSAENGAIRAGDLLTTARTPGHAMKAKAALLRGLKIYPTGAILGKALQPLKRGTGVINVLLMLR